MKMTDMTLPMSTMEATLAGSCLNCSATMKLNTAGGSAENVQIKQSSGFARLDEAAAAAVRQWRFVPARRGAEPIAASVMVPIVFRLE